MTRCARCVGAWLSFVAASATTPRSTGTRSCCGFRRTLLIDVRVLSQEWVGAVEVVGLGAELLDGLVVRGAPAFESWLLAERRRVAAAAEAILHEAALGLMARGALDRARGFAVRAAAMSPLDENHQVLLIRLYRLMGDDVAAERQYRRVDGVACDRVGGDARRRD